MHVVIALIYGFTSWLSAMAYAIIARPDIFAVAFFCGPLIVSGSMIVLFALDCGLSLALRALRARFSAWRHQ